LWAISLVESRDYSLLREAVKRIVNTLGRVHAVILFGSRARGDWLPWSDYDLLIIADFREPYLERIKKLLDLLSDIPLPIEPHPYTLEEAISMLKKGNPTIVDALEEGVRLYEGEGFKRLVELFNELKRRGLKRTETTIIVPEETS
jgi:predicted nucleotidyltransferase